MSQSTLAGIDHGDIVMSSRVRIARNLDSFVFPHIISEQEARQVSEQVRNALEKENSYYKNRFHSVRMKEIDEIHRQVLVEEHGISPSLAANVNKGEVMMDKKSGCSIMIHEEDHLRIQCFRKGLYPDSAFKQTHALEKWMGKNLSFAYDENLGFLTACPTNVGTGMRVSVMLHLPALTILGQLDGLVKAAGQLGFVIRGVFGEGTAYLGNLCQISNQITLGVKEEEIIGNLEDMTKQVILKEQNARKYLMDQRTIQLEDRVFRSLGTLKHARLMGIKEAMDLLSNLILGASLGIHSDYSLTLLHGLIEQIQPARLQKEAGKRLTEAESDGKRAEKIGLVLRQGGNSHVYE